MILKALIKKQLREIFQNYFYDQKKKKTRTKANAVALFVLFGFLMIGIIGGSLAAAAVGIGQAMIPEGLAWMYYLIFSGIAILLGAFGSVFSTYQGLYLSKDNDLLLSMPIPVRVILTARLIGVYLMGLMYSAVVTLPAVIFCWVMSVTTGVGLTVLSVVGGILYVAVISLIVFILSCLLGFVVAKLSQKLKNKSFAVVAISLLCIALYYVVYFKAQDWIRELCLNAVAYGAQVAENAPFLVFLGGLGAGNPLSVVAVTLGTVALLIGTMYLISRSFLSIATAVGTTAAKPPKPAKAEKIRTPFGALVKKEFRRFSSSASYILNCSLGLLFLPAIGILLLVGGGTIREVLGELMEGLNFSFLLPYVPAALLLFVAMIDIAAPTVSLEGKGFWQLQTLPIDMRKVILAKMVPQFVLSLPALLFVAVCFVIALPVGAVGTVLTIFAAVVLAILNTIFDMAAGVRYANIYWNNEIVPIKQGAAVSLSIFGIWGVGVILAGVGFALSLFLSPMLVFAVELLLCLGISALLWRGLMTKGATKLLTL
ncbi:MAG: hypothetical protein MJ082_04840 [Clostridia bacterium]|nr:hypothetical protein [Clostridia bacterium]